MHIEMVYGNASTQVLLNVHVPEGCTVKTAITVSGILQQFPHLKLNELSVGIFSQKATLETVLHPGDRVEIYRPLLMDPKAARRLRAEK